MRRVLCVVLCAALLGGCYSIPRWSPGPVAPEQNFKRDDYQCIRETWQRGAAGLGAIVASNNESKRLYIMCMELRGWTQTDDGVKGGWRPL
jgi:hypothetical protein